VPSPGFEPTTLESDVLTIRPRRPTLMRSPILRPHKMVTWRVWPIRCLGFWLFTIMAKHVLFYSPLKVGIERFNTRNAYQTWIRNLIICQRQRTRNSPVFGAWWMVPSCSPLRDVPRTAGVPSTLGIHQSR
jgi:hypothetical protein